MGETTNLTLVRRETGARIEVICSSRDVTMGDIRDFLADLKRVSIDKIVLKRGYRKLEDQYSLDFYRITDGEILNYSILS
ncbi:hypothetical protein P3X46_021562 [Hevea brasiliensis]|uniref:Ubiquitin-like domain-containing protein n=1 Tax=Hevea brasiliensis TaxID=3981 RepID=A0ABQ9LJS2_HEVBR|nr:hypothetical protein P3X46_021562 [Hevea brasiliensis]